eukprot:CAMPEP_0197023182 /NCGR_PEP_ID=MMETSP1384-20130603/3967_1 /TAXON_ID=29189 /ORGANISM="Ammonia sp." /LENGTH=316 /DNA_ID=CAMNT_0042451369 /DNA_START=65 /DNA_END=1015 /DNA_ORIENTATION=+
MATSSIFTLIITSFIAAYSQSGFTFDGGEYKCEGDEVCAGTYIDDFPEISNLICKGFCSCCQSYMTFTCIEDKCNIECEEEDSCADTTIQLDSVESVSCGEPRACQEAAFALDVVEGFKFECSDEEACLGVGIAAVLDTSDSEAHMDEFQCDGENACSEATVNMNRLEKFSCEGYRACNGGLFTFYNPAEDFTISCEGDSACQSATISLQYSPLATEFTISSIECESSQACEFMKLSITNLASETVYIKELKCEGFQACDTLTVAASGLSSVVIEKCICEEPEPYACMCTAGLDAVCQEFEGEWSSSGTDAYSCTF